MKFLDRLDLRRAQLLGEADEAPLPPGAKAGNADENPTPQEVQQTQDEQPAEPVKLSPEGEVMLIRLLKKAFVIQPRPEDIEQMTDLDDINESNARESLQKIIGLMKKYSTDIDIDVD